MVYVLLRFEMKQLQQRTGVRRGGLSVQAGWMRWNNHELPKSAAGRSRCGIVHGEMQVFGFVHTVFSVCKTRKSAARSRFPITGGAPPEKTTILCSPETAAIARVEDGGLRGTAQAQTNREFAEVVLYRAGNFAPIAVAGKVANGNRRL
jgi:hypothetical protein